MPRHLSAVSYASSAGDIHKSDTFPGSAQLLNYGAAGVAAKRNRKKTILELTSQMLGKGTALAVPLNPLKTRGFSPWASLFSHKSIYETSSNSAIHER